MNILVLGGGDLPEREASLRSAKFTAKAGRKAGISNVELVTKLINYAEERWQTKQKLATSFNTNYLKQF